MAAMGKQDEDPTVPEGRATVGDVRTFRERSKFANHLLTIGKVLGALAAFGGAGGAVSNLDAADGDVVREILDKALDDIEELEAENQVLRSELDAMRTHLHDSDGRFTDFVVRVANDLGVRNVGAGAQPRTERERAYQETIEEAPAEFDPLPEVRDAPKAAARKATARQLMDQL